MKDDRLYLIHIKEAIEWIEKYTEDGEKAFLVRDPDGHAAKIVELKGIPHDKSGDYTQRRKS